MIAIAFLLFLFCPSIFIFFDQILPPNGSDFGVMSWSHDPINMPIAMCPIWQIFHSYSIVCWFICPPGLICWHWSRKFKRHLLSKLKSIKEVLWLGRPWAKHMNWHVRIYTFSLLSFDALRPYIIRFWFFWR